MVLPVLDARRVLRALKKAGFAEETTRGSHRKMVNPGPPRRVVSVPLHGSSDLKRKTLASIVRQAGMSDEEFTALL